MRRPSVLTVAVLTLVVAAATACGGDDDSSGSSGSGSLPPNRKSAIAEPYTDELEEMGLRITRAALVERDTGRPGPQARHLAVYVEPTGAYSADEFADGIVGVTRVFLPDAFDRWSGLESFDVCQEPEPGVDDRQVPEPRTQIDISRAESAAVDWETVELGSIVLAAGRDGDDIFRVYADDGVTASTSYQEQVEAAADATSAPAPGARPRY
jgi:hypothetical protein